MTASNYPPGVTGNEPQIAGEEHYRECPLHPEFEFSDSQAAMIDPYEVKALVEAADWGNGYPGQYPHRPTVRDALRPFRWLLDCHCEEIAEGLKEAAQEYKEQFRHDNDI